MRVRDRRFWIGVSLIGWAAIAVVGSQISQDAEAIFLSLLVVQQAVFLIGGWKAARPEIFHVPHFGEILTGLFSGVGLHIANTAAGILAFSLFSYLLGEATTWRLIAQERSGVEAFLIERSPFAALAMMFLVLIGAPITEEVFFRGAVLDVLQEHTGPTKAVLLSALLFAVFHFYFIQFLPVMISGVLLGTMFVRSRTIYRSIIAHATANGLALVALILQL